MAGNYRIPKRRKTAPDWELPKTKKYCTCLGIADTQDEKYGSWLGITEILNLAGNYQIPKMKKYVLDPGWELSDTHEEEILHLAGNCRIPKTKRYGTAPGWE